MSPWQTHFQRSIPMQFRRVICCAAIAVSAPWLVWAQTSRSPAQPGTQHAVSTGVDADDIRTVMKKQFDRPDATLSVEPITVQGSTAVAGWVQENRGGRALLRKTHGRWTISACAGDGLTQADVLYMAGLQPAAAQALAHAVQRAEASLSKERLALFASFEGMVQIDPHAQGDHHSAHHKP
jgi:hypothetical protein